MKYSDKILDQVIFLNSVLKEYHQVSVFENPNFIIDSMSWEEFLKIGFRKSGHVNFDIVCSSNDFQLNIDRAVEILDISSNDFEPNKNAIKEYFKLLFTCTAKVEYCGSHYTKIDFIDNKGNCLKTLD